MAVDWWTLGTMMYEMFYGWSPFYNDNKGQILNNIKYGNPRFINTPNNNDLNDLLQKLLEKNPQKRLGTVGGAQSIKQHGFFRNVDWEKLKKKEYQAPFVPQLEWDADVQNFDSMFTQQCVSPLSNEMVEEQ